MTTETANKPTHSIRYGNIRATIWENENGYNSVVFDRSYKVGDEWNSTQSFTRDDLPKLNAAAEDAYRWIFQNATESVNKTG